MACRCIAQPEKFGKPKDRDPDNQLKETEELDKQHKYYEGLTQKKFIYLGDIILVGDHSLGKVIPGQGSGCGEDARKELSFPGSSISLALTHNGVSLGTTLVNIEPGENILVVDEKGKPCERIFYKAWPQFIKYSLSFSGTKSHFAYEKNGDEWSWNYKNTVGITKFDEKPKKILGYISSIDIQECASN